MDEISFPRIFVILGDKGDYVRKHLCLNHLTLGLGCD